jgi:hypothetical protein
MTTAGDFCAIHVRFPSKELVSKVEVPEIQVNGEDVKIEL